MARGARHSPRTARFRADEVLDALHGALLRNDRPSGARQWSHAHDLPDRQRRAARTPPRRPSVQPLFPLVDRRVHLHVGTGARGVEGLYLRSGALFAASVVREFRCGRRARRGVPPSGARSCAALCALLRVDPRLQGAGYPVGRMGAVPPSGAPADRGGGVLCLAGAIRAADRGAAPRRGGDSARFLRARRRREVLFLGGRRAGAALQDRHAERRDADRLQFRAADDRHRRGRSARDRTRRPCGVCLPPDAAGVADALVRICEGDTLARFRSAMREEKRRFSWEEMCDRITELYESIR